jgi:hypothetical protein
MSISFVAVHVAGHLVRHEEQHHAQVDRLVLSGVAHLMPILPALNVYNQLVAKNVFFVEVKLGTADIIPHVLNLKNGVARVSEVVAVSVLVDRLGGLEEDWILHEKSLQE